ncbi:MAG: hypothetical protein SAJ37_11545 [Oscillatoria sp. PMC 1068.18]|nr:hypothetical protein [Oscillatoria sp. PMC 1076.18]MEC4989373.1 hypothetical protein [Oscillatoria sp. PMC 1068.18]
MFALFQKRYPSGSLISEFVTVDRGQYVVRAIAVDDGVTLATSLAAAFSVEEAEDQARKRLFAFLGITNGQVAAIANQPTTTISESKTPVASTSAQTQPPKMVSEQVTSTVTPTEKPNPVTSTTNFPEEPELSPSIPVAQSAAEIADFTPEPEPISVAPEPVYPTKKFTQKASQLSPEMDRDLLMEGTSVEIKRLGWNESQGREFLNERYGKRSRHSLTDEELSEFHQYLLQQPSPQ